MEELPFLAISEINGNSNRNNILNECLAIAIRLVFISMIRYFRHPKIPFCALGFKCLTFTLYLTTYFRSTFRTQSKIKLFEEINNGF